MDKVKLHVYSSSSEIQNQLCDFIAAAAHKAAHDHGHFSVGLSGHRLEQVARPLLRRASRSIHERGQHARVHKKELLDHVEVPENNIYTIDPSLDVSEAAEDYIAKLRKLYPGEDHPSFDLLLLGIGPDGHTCSLFPGHPALHEKTRSVVPIHDSPKPPPTRITLTFPVLNRAKMVAVVATGNGKADAVKGCLEPESEDKTLPGGRVKPTRGELHWFMDEGAAVKLTRK
eukprot:Em0419g9a